MNHMSLLDEMAKELAGRYKSASQGEQVTEIHLFGIRHASALDGVSLPDLLARAGMPDSYKTEIRKGIRLAPYVSIKSATK